LSKFTLKVLLLIEPLDIVVSQPSERLHLCMSEFSAAEATDRRALVGWYDELVERMPSPVVELNRAVVFGRAYGADKVLPLVDALQADLVMQRYGLLHAVRGDLLARLDRVAEACQAFQLAAELATNEQDKALMLRRADELRD
jgi:predicted RNA polymerase sigma factor